MAQAKVARGFRALVDFWCHELNCQYAEGMTYTVRVGNDALAERAERWVADGRAEWTDDENGVPIKPEGAAVSGTGIVT